MHRPFICFAASNMYLDVLIEEEWHPIIMGQLLESHTPCHSNRIGYQPIRTL